MTLRARLGRLERATPKAAPNPGPLTDAERYRRAQALVAYPGDDPAVLARRARLAELLEAARRRKLAAEKARKR